MDVQEKLAKLEKIGPEAMKLLTTMVQDDPTQDPAFAKLSAPLQRRVRRAQQQVAKAVEEARADAENLNLDAELYALETCMETSLPQSLLDCCRKAPHFAQCRNVLWELKDVGVEIEAQLGPKEAARVTGKLRRQNAATLAFGALLLGLLVYLGPRLYSVLAEAGTAMKAAPDSRSALQALLGVLAPPVAKWLEAPPAAAAVVQQVASPAAEAAASTAPAVAAAVGQAAPGGASKTGWVWGLVASFVRLVLGYIPGIATGAGTAALAPAVSAVAYVIAVLITLLLGTIVVDAAANWRGFNLGVTSKTFRFLWWLIRSVFKSVAVFAGTKIAAWWTGVQWDCKDGSCTQVKGRGAFDTQALCEAACSGSEAAGHWFQPKAPAKYKCVKVRKDGKRECMEHAGGGHDSLDKCRAECKNWSCVDYQCKESLDGPRKYETEAECSEACHEPGRPMRVLQAFRGRFAGDSPRAASATAAPTLSPPHAPVAPEQTRGAGEGEGAGDSSYASLIEKFGCVKGTCVPQESGEHSSIEECLREPKCSRWSIDEARDCVLDPAGQYRSLKNCRDAVTAQGELLP